MTTLTLHPALPVAANPSRRWSRLALAAIALGGLLLTLITHRYYGTFIRGADAQMYYAQVRSLVVDGDLQFDNEITQLTPNRAVYYDAAGELRVARTADGRIINKYTIGWALLTVPPFACVHLIQSITGGDTSGYSTAYDLAVALWHLALVVAACAALMRAIATITDDRSAAIAGVGTFFTTNVLYYTGVYPTMAHAASFAVVGGAMAVAIRLHQRPIDRVSWRMAGALSAIIVLLRPTDAVLLIAFAPAAVSAWRCGSKRSVLLIPLGVALAIAFQLVIWRISYGSWVANSYGHNGEGFHWFRPAISAILTSTNHGAWYFHPFLFAGFVGLIIASLSRSTHRAFFAALLVASVVHIYVHACWHDWAFSHSFGHRLFANSAPLAMIGAALLVHRLSAKGRAAAIVVLALFIGWNALLTVTFIKGNIPAVGAVSPGEMIEAQVKTVSTFISK